jgi:lipopolysaccharide export system protein LptA
VLGRASAALAVALVCASPALAAPSPLRPGGAPPGAAPRPAASASAAPAPDGFPGGGLETRDYKIETDKTQSNLNSGDFKMPDKVRFYRPGTDATADHAEGNYKRGTAILIGNVVVHDSGNAPEAGSEKSYAGNGPATLTCDRLEVDSKAKTYTAIGNVHFQQGDQTGTAQRAVLDRTNNLLHMEGDVRLTQGGSSMTAQNLDYNLANKDVNVTGAPITIKQPVPSAPPGTPKPSPSPRKRGL